MDARADEGETGEVEQALNRSVLAVGSVHHGEDDVNALAAATAVQFYEGRVSGVGGHHDALAALQDFRQHFLRAGAYEPVAFFGDAAGHAFVFSGIAPPHDASCDAPGD